MIRKIITIDEELCNGCGLCANKCAEGALQIIDGKAKLVSEVYCDGLGACIGDCPLGAITIGERDVKPFDEQAVHEHLSGKHPEEKPVSVPLECGCPGSAMRSFRKDDAAVKEPFYTGRMESQLTTWPVQLNLVPAHAPFLKGADILISADCVPYALPDFHRRFLCDRVVLVGCPKLDDISFYREKLRNIFMAAEPSSITVLRMEVPCCGGIARAVISARDETVPDMPVEIHTVGIRGEVTCETIPPVLRAKSEV
ncbi:MAG: 4Fe-4S binding protein [Candidatus Latescibacter sp.]|nr:4Fe-4S binding protein [Candidatus Latescibacter sp.]